MAAFKTKSNELTNYLATPRTETNAFLSGAFMREKVATLETAVADTTGDVLAFMTIPSGARVSSIELFNDAITTTGSYDVGLYTVDAAGTYTVVSAALFGSAVALTSAHVTPLDVTYEATATNIDKIEKRLWELLALTVDPFAVYVIALTATDDTATAGTVCMRTRYAI